MMYQSQAGVYSFLLFYFDVLGLSWTVLISALVFWCSASAGLYSLVQLCYEVSVQAGVYSFLLFFYDVLWLSWTLLLCSDVLCEKEIKRRLSSKEQFLSFLKIRNVLTTRHIGIKTRRRVLKNLI